jgi:hypothetical protein
MQNTLTVETEFGPVVVKRLALGDYAEFLRVLKKLPASLGEFIQGTDSAKLKEMEMAEFMEILPSLIADSWDEFAGLIAVATDKDREFVLKLDGADALDIIDGIMQLNRFSKIVSAVKKMMARRAQAQAPVAQPAEQSTK